ncbi:MAG: FAD-dependent oxidoreductase [Dehalobacter sp.]|nr:FAD-dependent oxidoreductase [Dehalobacter sp.]
MSNFKYLFTPIKIGSMELQNRIMMAPHALIGWPPASDEHVGYFEARAKGGAGMMVIGSCVVQPFVGEEGLLRCYDRDEIPKLAKIINAIHKWGSKAIVQGILGTGGAPGTRVPAKSVPTSIWGDYQNRELSLEDIQQLIKDHGQAAANAQEAGADGIEFPAGGGVGLQFFYSPLGNKRTDAYGGDVEGRTRILVEIANEVKARCGRDFNIGYVVNADETILGGPGLDVGTQACKILADTENVDWLRITAGGQKPQSIQLHYPSSYLPQGTQLYAAAAVREVVDNIPIIGGGRVNSAEFAEQALAEGQCDLVYAARAFLCDPEWPNKAKRGDTEEIRNCIGDVEGCFLRITSGAPAGCTCNPDLQREHLALPMAEKKKKIAVIGGGPAGMQAALVAAKRGHNVTLLERTGALGGHILMEAQLPGLADRADLPRWLTLQLQKQNVDIRLDEEATAESVISLQPDAVVVATGSEYARTGISHLHMMPITGVEADYVLTPEDVILAKNEVGQKVVVYDATGYLIGPGIAEMFADQGKEVTFICPDPAMAKSVHNIGVDKLVALRVLTKAQFIPNTMISGIDDHTLGLTNILTYQIDELNDVDTVILVTCRPPRDELYDELKGRVPELHVIGDANDSHWSAFCIDDAIKAGQKIGMQL